VPNTVLAILSPTPTSCEAVRASRVCSERASPIAPETLLAQRRQNIIRCG